MGTKQQQSPTLLGFNPLALNVLHLLPAVGAKLVREHAEILEGQCFACHEWFWGKQQGVIWTESVES